MSNVKDLIKEKLNQLSKEELVDTLADVCAIRENCVRYRLFCMWEKRPYKFAPFVEFPAYNTKTEQCEMLKPIE